MKDSIAYLTKSDLEDCKRCFFVFGKLTKKCINKISRYSAKDLLVILTPNTIGFSGKEIGSLEGDGIIFRVFTLQAFPFHVRYKADKRSQLLLDEIFRKMEGGGKVPSRMLKKLYDDVQVRLAYKKFVIEKIKSLLVIDEAADHLLTKNCLINIHLDSSTREIMSWRGQSDLVFSNFNSAEVSYSSFHYVESILRKILFFSKIMILPLFVISKAKHLELNHPRKRKDVELLLPVFNTDWRLPDNKYSVAVDWPIDGDIFHKNNTLFVSEDTLDQDYKDLFNKRKYSYIDLALFANQSIKYIIKYVLWPIFKLIPAVFRDVINAHGSLLEVTLKGQYIYYQWSLFLVYYEPKRLVCYQGVSLRHVFRNILLRKSGCVSWRYDHTFNFNHNIYEDSDEEVCSTVDISYLNYDYELHWGEINTRAFINSGSCSNKHIMIDPIWGYVFDGIEVSEVLTALGLPNGGADHVIVSAFNTSFGPTAYSDNDTHIAFLEAIETFLGSDVARKNNVIVLFKGKYPICRYFDENDDRLSSVAKRLMDDPRVVDVENKVSPTVLIKISRLVVSMAYTSTGMEALMLGRRSIYFDNNFSYKNSVFLQLNRAVSSTAKELIESMEYWLEVDDDTFKNYRDGVVRPFYKKDGKIGENPFTLFMR